MGKDSSFYETFDSGTGPTYPDKFEKDSANRDSAGGLSADGEDVEQGAVPQMPQVKK